jgi:hypothetical protein
MLGRLNLLRHSQAVDPFSAGTTCTISDCGTDHTKQSQCGCPRNMTRTSVCPSGEGGVVPIYRLLKSSAFAARRHQGAFGRLRGCAPRAEPRRPHCDRAGSQAQRLTHAVDPKRLAKELGFALACFRELMTLFLDFFEQPHILDRDQRLVSEKGPAR